ncbi:DUF5133 domain-containing protein [Streptomyces bobili]|uniref:DUF5133 domain-containing protein n=1 Tax=Streptomyces bobili TaxID=67280 RepID=UPI00225A9C2B|nr:DUF5133 domain-containing protein [Streptomyces bobili]MCX5528309.1 DUF5133 domain-containing protein [Streptomyces bobili]
MLMPHPAVLRTLVDEYEATKASGSAEDDMRAQDLAYTLCVSTGTREVDRALEVARGWLAAATADDTTTRTADGFRVSAADRPHVSTDDGPRVYA